MRPLRQSLSIADSHDFAPTIARSNYVAAVELTSLQRSWPAIAGSHFAAGSIITLRQSRSIADSASLLQPSLASTTLFLLVHVCLLFLRLNANKLRFYYLVYSTAATICRCW